MRSQVFLGICITLLVAGSLHAATRTFTGAVDQSWSNPGNWDAIPGVDDKARVRSEKPCILDYDAGVINQYVGEGGTIGHLILVDGAQLSVRTWSIIGYNGGEPDARHTIEVLGGVLNGGHPDYPNNGRIFVGREGYAHLIIDYTGVVNVLHQPFQIGQGSGGDGIVEIRGGELNLNSGLVFRAGANSSASMDFSGGVMTQPYTATRLAYINDHIADGTITAYGKVIASYGAGTVLVETIDDTIVVKGLHPFNPVPEDGGAVDPGSTTLEWTVDASTLVDVWFGTKADLSDFTKIVDKQAVTSTTVTTVAKQRYFWAVDTYLPGETDPELGIVFDFTADNQPPIVDAGADLLTWLGDDGTRAKDLVATISDDDAYTVQWTVVSEPDDPNSPDAVIVDPIAEDTSITLSAVGEYVLQLEAFDGEYTGSDTITVNVYNDGCEAAQSLPDYIPLPGDLNGDCKVDDLDLAILQEDWLEDNSLIEP
ncbi:MAG: hypothetical protein ACYSUD_00650 [Planctomycetota bacterium]|jgi:hypothetical protein